MAALLPPSSDRHSQHILAVPTGTMSAKPPKPNAFVSLRIPSLSIRRELEQVQEAMVGRDQNVKAVLISLSKLHITLTVIRLENEDEIEK